MHLVVAHPDTQHSVHAALGLKRAGMLRCLLTSASLRRPAWLDPALRRVAPSLRERLAQHRGHEGFTAEELRVFPLHLVASRMGARSWAWSQALFGRRAGRLGIREGCGVMAFNTNALETFRLLKRAGLPCILDQTIAYRRWSDEVGQRACDENPEWGDSWAAPAWRAEEEDEELALADLVLCGSEFCKRTLISGGVPPSKIAVAEYGADTARFTPRATPGASGAVRLLFVGTLALRKGIHHLLEAVRRLQRRGVRLTAAGATCVRPEMLRRYADVLEVTGFRLHGEMPALYRDHDLYVFPSLVEGSSLSIYEAMASGLPVVTTPNAGSIVRDGVDGFIVPPGDVDGLASAIERLVEDRDLRLAMGRSAVERARSYGDWRHYGDRLAGAIQARFDER